ncbi:unnamed protein product [Urochloa humidicola]
METLTDRTAASDLPPARPPCVMLNPYVNNMVDSDSAVADAQTRAASCTSSGQSFTLSIDLAPPPATSNYYCDWIGGALGSCSSDEGRRHRPFPNRDESKNLHVIAAHEDSLLIKMMPPDLHLEYRYANTWDYFLYETGGAARPPSLSLLPGSPRTLDTADTGVLRRGEGEFLVARLKVIYPESEGPYDTAEICVLRPGGSDWDLKQLPIVHHEGGKLVTWPELDAAVPVGTRFMCWVDYVSGLFVCDMAKGSSSHEVKYVPIPVPPPKQHHREQPYLPYCRNLAAAGIDGVRFVSVAPRCCCGGPGKTECERSRYAFNVTTWTLTLRMEGTMTWVKDGVLDCDELWQLPNYGCLPRVVPRYPIVGSENADIVCLYLVADADETQWMLQINTRSKELLSVVRGDTNLYIDYRVSAKLRWQLGN